MVVVRKTKAHEAAAIAAIGFRAWDARLSVWTEGHDNVAAIRENARQAYVTFTHRCWDAILVAQTDEGLIGWGCCEDGRDVPEPRENAISDLWVDPPFQRRGVGQALLAALEAQAAAAGHHCCLLETHARNNAAIAFFRSNGYAVKWLSTKYSVGLDRDIETVGLEKQFMEDAAERPQPAG